MSRFLFLSVFVATGFVAIICWEAQSAWPSATARPTGRSVPPALSLTTQARAPDDPVDTWVTTSLDRPLLRESRRPDKVADAQRKSDDILRLAGIVTGAFGDRAIFIIPGNAKPVVATVGAQVSDFIVRSIEPGRVLVDAAGALRTYKPVSAGHNGSMPAVLKRR